MDAKSRSRVVMRTDTPVVHRLVCEGPCNPQLAHVERLVEGARRDDHVLAAKGQLGVVLPLVDPGVLTALRTLRHTNHVYVGRTWRGTGRWQCRTCQHIREY